MKQQISPLQIAISIIAVVCIAVVLGILLLNSRPSVPATPYIPPVADGTSPPPPTEKTYQVVGPDTASGKSAYNPPAKGARGSTTINGAPQQPIGPPPPIAVSSTN